MEELKRTALYDWHREAGARMAPFAGWEMPIQYPTGAIEEHHLVRRSAGIFDIGHMGCFEVAGGEAEAFLDRIVSSRMSGLADGESRYGLLCREDGGILDDLFVYRLSPARFLVVVNASNTGKDFAWFRKQGEGKDLSLRDASGETAILALQGPRALEILRRAGDLDALPERFFSARGRVAGRGCLVGRTGYTGEDGVEIYLPREDSLSVWEALLRAGAEAGIDVGPAGLAARDSLRFEPGFALYGHELSEDITPVEAGLLWACDLGKPFVGREAVAARKAEGAREKLATFEMVEKSVPREGFPVEDEEGKAAGRVVSGMLAPTLGKFAGNAYLRPDLASPGKTFYIVVRGARKKAVAVRRPLYTPAYRKQ